MFSSKIYLFIIINKFRYTICIKYHHRATLAHTMQLRTVCTHTAWFTFSHTIRWYNVVYSFIVYIGKSKWQLTTVKEIDVSVKQWTRIWLLTYKPRNMCGWINPVICYGWCISAFICGTVKETNIWNKLRMPSANWFIHILIVSIWKWTVELLRVYVN